MKPGVAVAVARPRRSPLWLLGTLCVIAAGPAAARNRPPPPAWVWWEAETPSATNFPATHPFVPSDPRGVEALSGGRWIGAPDLGNDRPREPLFLEYEVTVPLAGEYRLYARKFWQHGPFRWRVDRGPWRLCGRDRPLLDRVSLAKLVEVNWIDAGTIQLTAGAHRLRVELTENNGPAAFDCFLLTKAPFVARGKLKPGERYPPAPEGWFAFDPDPDAFGAAAVDLRALNERVAGEGGTIQARGGELVHEKTGKPVRFWAVNAGHEILGHEPAALARYARRLAKLGVNMVRLHGPLWRDDDITRVDRAKLAKVHDLVAALRAEGIYLCLSTYFPSWLRPKDVPGLEGFDGSKNTVAVPFFNERFQALQKSWWREALSAPNPRTNLPLIADPALAFIEIQNEDSLFFWTFSPYENVPAPQMALLEARFGRWLAAKYGNLAAATGRWRGGPDGWGRVRGDGASAGRAGFMALWELSQRRDERAQDTAQFLAELERSYYDGMRAFLKTELGFRGSVTGSNWITADAARLGPLDKWANAGCDFMDRHGYYAGPHQGEQAGYMISEGDRYDDASALRLDSPDRDLPLFDTQWAGKPSTISELNWTMPNRFRAELPVLAAAYGALQGTDALFFFASNDIDWPRSLEKFSAGDPAIMGQFPAAALMYRQGLVKIGAPVVRIDARLGDLFALKGLPAAIDPLAHLVGRVEIRIDAADGEAPAAQAASFIDTANKIARSQTGQLTWDWGRGLVKIDAPAAQGATGFLARAGAVALGDLTLTSALEYGSALLVSLDGQPLSISRRMLLQVMSEDQNAGWSAPGTGLRRIADTGRPPILVRKLAGSITLRRADAAELRVTTLDANGYPSGSPHLGARSIALAPTTLAYVIEK